MVVKVPAACSAYFVRHIVQGWRELILSCLFWNHLFFIKQERDMAAEHYGTSTKQALEIQKMDDSRESQKAHRKPRVNASWLNVQSAK